MRFYTKLFILAIILMIPKTVFAAGAWPCPTLSASDAQTLLNAHTFTDSNNHQWTVRTSLPTVMLRVSSYQPTAPILMNSKVSERNTSICDYNVNITYSIMGNNSGAKPVRASATVTFTLIQ